MSKRTHTKPFHRFKLCESSFFHWGVVVAPTSAKALLNYALVQQVVNDDYNAAEKFYRRALDFDPNDEAVVQNYEDFLDNRLPGGLFASGVFG